MEISKTTHQPASAFKGIQAWMQQHPMFSFFFMAYGLSWIVFIPYVLAERGILKGNFTFFYILHTFGPAIAAIVMTSILTGRTGLQNLRQRIRQWRAPWQWYLFLLVGIPALVMIGIILQPGAMEGYKGFTTSLLVRYPFYLITAFLGVGLGEETGWRGFALPQMQKQYSPLWGTLLLGVLLS